MNVCGNRFEQEDVPLSERATHVCTLPAEHVTAGDFYDSEGHEEWNRGRLVASWGMNLCVEWSETGEVVRMLGRYGTETVEHG